MVTKVFNKSKMENKNNSNLFLKLSKKLLFGTMGVLTIGAFNSCTEQSNSVSVSFKKEKDTTPNQDTIKPNPRLLFKNQRVALFDGKYHVIDSSLYSLPDNTLAFLQRVDTSFSGVLGGAFGSITGTVYYQKEPSSKWVNLSFKIGDTIEIGLNKYAVVSFELSNKNKKFNLLQFINTKTDSTKFLNEYSILEAGLNTLVLYYNALNQYGKVYVKQQNFTKNIQDLFVGINNVNLIKTDIPEWKKLPFNSKIADQPIALIKNFWEHSEQKDLHITLVQNINNKTIYSDTVLKVTTGKPQEYSFDFGTLNQKIKILLLNIDSNEFKAIANPSYYLMVESKDKVVYTSLLTKNQTIGLNIDGTAIAFQIK